MFEPLQSQRERQADDHGSVSAGNVILLYALILGMIALSMWCPL